MKLRFIRGYWQNRELIARLSQREVVGRYRGSFIGISWTVVQPLAMLAVYTFVFSQVFRSRWGNLDELGPAGFSLNLFAGLIVFNLFAECANKAPTLILENPNYVKKVVFPLEALGISTVAAATFHALMALAVLLAFQVMATGRLSTTLWVLPVVWLPLVMGALATTWLLSAMGVFLRDLQQLVGVTMNMLLFLSPVFFPISSLPVNWQKVLGANPLGLVIEQTRAVILANRYPSLLVVAAEIILTIGLCEWSYRLFERARRGFADVL